MQKNNKNMMKTYKTQLKRFTRVIASLLLLTLAANFLNIFIAPEKAHAASQVRYPSGDISAAGTWAVFPTSPTTKWDKVDEVGANDGDTSYLTHGTTAGSALFSFSAFSIPAGAIITNLTVTVVARDVTSGTNKVQPAIRVNGVNYLTTSTSTEVPTGYTAISYAYTTNPNTTASWTVDNINGVAGSPLQGFGTNSADANPAFRITQVYATVNYTIPNTAPTAVLNTPTDGSTIYTDTPDLVSTCTDANGDTVEYNLQLDTVNSFDSVPSSFDLKYVDLYLATIGTPTDNVLLDIRSTSFGGTSLGQSGAVAATSVSATPGWFRFTFATPITLSGTTTYYMTLSRSGTRDTTNYVRLWVTSNQLYSGGQLAMKSSGIWDSASYVVYDAAFVIYDTNTVAKITQNVSFTYMAGLYGAGGTNEEYGQSFTMLTSVPLLSKFSNIPDATFTDVTNGANTHPFPSGDQVKYTIQPGDALTPGGTYYWRVACLDPSGSNTYGAWSSTYSFIVDASVPTLGEILFLVLIGCAVFIGVKSGVIKLKPSKDEPLDKKPPKDIHPILPDTHHQRSIDGIRKIPKKDL